MRRVATCLSVLAALLLGCTDGPSDFGVAPAEDGPELPSDRGLDLASVDGVEEPPPADAVLVDAGWADVAAWVERETDEGRPVVVNFFASWCDPCVRELPLLIETAEAEAGQVTFLGINHVDQRDLAEEMVEEFGITFPTLRDAAGEVVPEVGGRGLPHTVAFDADGRLVGRVFGELTATNLEGLLSEVR